LSATPRVVVVLPAYNAERTLQRTCTEIPRDVVDEVILVDDASQDRTVEVARLLGSDAFVFDNEMLCQAIYFGLSIGEVSSPCKYFPEASSIGFVSSLRYGLGVLRTAFLYRLSRLGLATPRIFSREGRRLR